MSISANVLIKTDNSTLVADIFATAFKGPVKQEGIEFGRKIWVDDRFSMAVVEAGYDDDDDKKFSLYHTAVIISAYSTDPSRRREELLSIGREVMQIVISKMRVACLLVFGIQELLKHIIPNSRASRLISGDVDKTDLLPDCGGRPTPPLDRG